MTLTLAIIGTVLGILNLFWNMRTWRLSGPVVAVTVNNAFPTYGRDIGEHHVGINAANTGRAPVTVAGMGIELPSRENMLIIEPTAFSTPLPHRLEPGSSADFYILADQVRKIARERGYSPGQLRPWVSLADGSKVFAGQGPLIE